MIGPANRTWAEISLRQLKENFRSISASVGPMVTVAPVVKADAYGHGLCPVASCLEQEGARWFAVSCTQEGVSLRNRGLRSRILVMGGVLPFEREAIFEYGLTPVVHSLKEVDDWERLARPLAVHLKIDTGMSRLGSNATPDQIVEGLQRLQYVSVEGLMSHFASAEDFSTEHTAEQMRRFTAVRAALHSSGVRPRIEHLSSTNAVAYRGKEAHLSLVRAGLSVYGYISPSVSGPRPGFTVKPVLTWHARLLSVREVEAGTPVGYMARYRAPQRMRIGTVAAGYADGIPHRLSLRGSLVSDGRLLPILGAVSMDLTTVDLTGAPELSPGDVVTVLGPGMDAQQIADIAGEIPYSVLCGIGNRVQRFYQES